MEKLGQIRRPKSSRSNIFDTGAHCYRPYPPTIVLHWSQTHHWCAWTMPPAQVWALAHSIPEWSVSVEKSSQVSTTMSVTMSPSQQHNHHPTAPPSSMITTTAIPIMAPLMPHTITIPAAPSQQHYYLPWVVLQTPYMPCSCWQWQSAGRKQIQHPLTTTVDMYMCIALEYV